MLIISDLDFCQIIVVYLMGVVLVSLLFYLQRVVSEVIGINHYITTLIYLISGYVGMLFMSPSVVFNNNNLFLLLWEISKISFVDFGASVILLILLYTIFAILPFGLITVILSIILKNKKSKKQKRGKINDKRKI